MTNCEMLKERIRGAIHRCIRHDRASFGRRARYLSSGKIVSCKTLGKQRVLSFLTGTIQVPDFQEHTAELVLSP